MRANWEVTLPIKRPNLVTCIFNTFLILIRLGNGFAIEICDLPLIRNPGWGLPEYLPKRQVLWTMAPGLSGFLLKTAGYHPTENYKLWTSHT